MLHVSAKSLLLPLHTAATTAYCQYPDAKDLYRCGSLDDYEDEDDGASTVSFSSVTSSTTAFSCTSEQCEELPLPELSDQILALLVDSVSHSDQDTAASLVEVNANHKTKTLNSFNTRRVCASVGKG
jgi:hypothetical protein